MFSSPIDGDIVYTKIWRRFIFDYNYIFIYKTLYIVYNIFYIMKY